MTGIGRAPRDGDLPLSFAQSRLWLLDQLGEDSQVYNIRINLMLRGALDVGALEWALGQILRRHEALRTTFEQGDDPPDGEAEPRQVVHPPGDFALRVEDCRGADDPEAEARRRGAENNAHTFDLGTAPLHRIALFTVSDRQHLLSIVLPHIVGDGWSAGVLQHELAQLYTARVRDELPRLPPLPIQYPDYAVWQRQWFETEAERLLEFWEAELADLPTLDLPTDRPRPAVQRFAGAQRRFSMPGDVAARLEALGRAEGCSFFMASLAAFQVLLARTTGADDVPVGTAVANRDRPETQGLIGFFMNMLVLRGDLAEAPSFRECLRRTLESTLEAFEHQEMPFDRLVVELAPERDASRNPLFQVVFLAEGKAPDVRLGDVAVEAVDLEHTTSKFDLTVSLHRTDGDLLGDVEWNRDLFDEATVERLWQHYQCLLEALLRDPDRSVWEVEYLTGDERERLLPARPRVDFGFSEPVHAVVARRAAAAPDAPALVASSGTWTYAQLDARSNQIAHLLRAKGAQPGTLVGVLLPRQPETVAAMLGAMKAGCAYVPLDPVHPAERQAMMVEDAGMPVLLTQAALLGQVAETAAQVVCLDRDAAEVGAQPTSPVEGDAATALDDLAYVIFTSGSTGSTG